MPAPIATPMRGEFSGVTWIAGIPEGIGRRRVAVVHERVHVAQLLRRQIFLGIEIRHRAVKAHGKCARIETSDRARCRSCPPARCAHAVSIVLPTGETMPRPVMTTRRLDKRLPH